MSRQEWGVCLLTVDDKKEAERVIRRLNNALAQMPMTDDEKQQIIFHWKAIPKRVKTVYIYALNLPERYHATLSQLPNRPRHL